MCLLNKQRTWELLCKMWCNCLTKLREMTCMTDCRRLVTLLFCQIRNLLCTRDTLSRGWTIASDLTIFSTLFSSSADLLAFDMNCLLTGRFLNSSVTATIVPSTQILHHVSQNFTVKETWNRLEYYRSKMNDDFKSSSKQE